MGGEHRKQLVGVGIQDAVVYPIRDNRVAPAQGLAQVLQVHFYRTDSRTCGRCVSGFAGINRFQGRTCGLSRGSYTLYSSICDPFPPRGLDQPCKHPDHRYQWLHLLVAPAAPGQYARAGYILYCGDLRDGGRSVGCFS